MIFFSGVKKLGGRNAFIVFCQIGVSLSIFWNSAVSNHPHAKYQTVASHATLPNVKNQAVVCQTFGTFSNHANFLIVAGPVIAKPKHKVWPNKAFKKEFRGP